MEFINKKSFFIKCAKLPSGTAQQRKYAVVNGRVMTYPSETYKKAKRDLTLLLKPHRPKTPALGAIYLSLAYQYETSTKKDYNTFKTTRPDGDNLLKVFKDVMTELGFWLDDSQVSVEAISRYFVPKGEGGIKVTIGEIKKEVF